MLETKKKTVEKEWTQTKSKCKHSLYLYARASGCVSIPFHSVRATVIVYSHSGKKMTYEMHTARKWWVYSQYSNTKFSKKRKKKKLQV